MVLQPWELSDAPIEESGAMLECATCPCVDPPGCNICASYSQIMIIKFSGVSNAACGDCGSYNSNFALAGIAGSACIWSSTNESGTTCDLQNFTLVLEPDGSDAKYRMTVTEGGIKATFEVTGLTLSGGTLDCDGNHTLPLVSHSGDGECNFSGASVELNP